MRATNIKTMFAAAIATSMTMLGRFLARDPDRDDHVAAGSNSWCVAGTSCDICGVECDGRVVDHDTEAGGCGGG
jgi:hypothetical protein